MSRVFWLFLFLILSEISVSASAIHQTRVFDSSEFVLHKPKLITQYGKNLICPEPYKLPMLIALSHYPEMRNISILVKLSKIKTTASCRPILASKGTQLELDSIVKKSRRKYIVRINIKTNFEGILLKDVPFNAQIGVFAHELAHIADYERRGNLGLVKRAVDYSKTKSKQKFENQIDIITIEHGMGWQLYDWADFALNRSTATEKYKAFKRKVYLSPEQITELLAPE